jgi:hypothetical protein
MIASEPHLVNTGANPIAAQPAGLVVGHRSSHAARLQNEQHGLVQLINAPLGQGGEGVSGSIGLDAYCLCFFPFRDISPTCLIIETSVPWKTH